MTNQPKKKRKTRRGKKGKGVNGGKGPRFILFVGNLPYDIKQVELISHFKNSNPDRIRIRQDKGIAFLEFDNENQEIQSKMELALRMHHSELRGRKINVELTVGGGGNSENRLAKLKEKNEKVYEERKKRVQDSKSKSKSSTTSKSTPPPNVHPSRAALFK
ncbi:Nucleolar protein 6 [Candida tropicalis]